MSARLRLGWKERGLFALIGVMLLSLPVLAVRTYIAKVTERNIHASPAPTDERLVAIDGRAMLFDPRQLGGVMAGWVKAQKERTLSFELSDLCFLPRSAATSAMGSTRVLQVVRVTRANPVVMVHIFLPTYVAGSVSRQLGEQRAARLRDALLSKGVSPSHVAVDAGRSDLPTTRGADIAVMLSK